MAKFFQAGQQQLQSTTMWSQHSEDRPAFQADVQRGLFRSGHFQVFAMPQGLLFLEMRLKDYGALGGGGSGGGVGGGTGGEGGGSFTGGLAGSLTLPRPFEHAESTATAIAATHRRCRAIFTIARSPCRDKTVPARGKFRQRLRRKRQ